MDSNYLSKVRVNGALLPQFSGKGVVVVGNVLKVDPSGTTVVLKASDGKIVNVIFEQPLMENLDGIVEVHGTCHGSQVRCQTYHLFPVEAAENFDMEAYDESVQLIHHQQMSDVLRS